MRQQNSSRRDLSSELGSSLLLPFILCYNIYQNRSIVYTDLYRMCPGTYLRNWIFDALALQLLFTGGLLALNSVRTVTTLYTFTEMPKASYSTEFVGRLMLYPFFMPLAGSVAALFLAIFYRYVTSQYAHLEDTGGEELERSSKGARKQLQRSLR